MPSTIIGPPNDAVARVAVELRLDAAGRFERACARLETPGGIEPRACPLEERDRRGDAGHLAGDRGEPREGHRREHLREDIPPLAQWPAVAGDGEEHPAVGVEAVPFEELHARPRSREPLLPRLDLRAQRREQPAEAALEPDALVVVVDAAVAVEAGDHAAVLAVEAVGHPEGDAVVEQAGPVGVAEGLERQRTRMGRVGGHVRRPPRTVSAGPCR